MNPIPDNLTHKQLWARFPQYLRATAASGIRSAIFLFAIGALVVSSGVTTGQAAGSGSLGQLQLRPQHASNDTLMTVTLDDPDINSITNRSEAIDGNGVAYAIPEGGVGQRFEIDLPNALSIATYADINDDGVVDANDFTVDRNEVSLVEFNATTSSLTIERGAVNHVDLSFAVSYRLQIDDPIDPNGDPYVAGAAPAGSTTVVRFPQTGVYDRSENGIADAPDFTVIGVPLNLIWIDPADGRGWFQYREPLASSTPFAIRYDVAATSTTDRFGNPLSLPASPAAEQFTFTVASPPLGDLNGDRKVDTNDVVPVGLTVGQITSVSEETGIITFIRDGFSQDGETFSISYGTAITEEVSVAVTSAADSTGLDLTLRETGPNTSVFDGTFSTGIESVTDNADNPMAAVRPVIKVTNDTLLQVRYTDPSPLTLVEQKAVIDTVDPDLTIAAPAISEYVFPTNIWVTVDIEDSGVGVVASQINVHVDVDRDGVFGELGEIVSPEPIRVHDDGHRTTANIELPDLGDDGPTEWYVEVIDRAGNTVRTDAAPSVAEDQNHKVIVDTVKPTVLTVTAGARYDATNEIVVLNQQNRVRVDFTEAIDPGSLAVRSFLVDTHPATSAFMIDEFPNTVWLSIPGLPPAPEQFRLETGGVADLAGLRSGIEISAVIDEINPILTLTLDRDLTRDIVGVVVESDEDLAAAPGISFEDETQGVAVADGIRRWAYVLDTDQLDQVIGTDGWKNIEASAFDMSGNLGFGGADPQAAGYPLGAARFQLDHAVSPPAVSPTNQAEVLKWDPTIVITYADEAFEYPGDTFGDVELIEVILDDLDVTDRFSSKNGYVWSFWSSGLYRGAHRLEIRGQDTAGNAHDTKVIVFTVAADPPPPDKDLDADVMPDFEANLPEPTPTPTPTATSTATSTSIPVVPMAGNKGDGDAGADGPISNSGPAGSEEDSDGAGSDTGDATPTASTTVTVSPTPADSAPSRAATSTPITEVPATETAVVPAPDVTATAEPEPETILDPITETTPEPSDKPAPEPVSAPTPTPSPDAGDSEPEPVGSPTPQPVPTPAIIAATSTPGATSTPHAETPPEPTAESPVSSDGPTDEQIQATAVAMMNSTPTPDPTGTTTINLFGFERYIQGDAAVDNSLYGASGLILLLSVWWWRR